MRRGREIGDDNERNNTISSPLIDPLPLLMEYGGYMIIISN